MVFPVNHLRLQVAGTLYGAQERFSWGVNLVENGGPQTPPETVPAAVLTALETFWGASGLTISQARIDQVKLNLIGPDGRYVDLGNTVVHDYETSIPGVSAATPPPQCAVAFTLHTSAARGRASRGRFYIPFSGAALPDGRLPLATCTGWGTTAATMLNALEDALPGWRLAVLSSIGAGTVRPVTGVSVGRVVDTIRSRRRSMAEENPAPTPVGGF